jgi:hypothetical protein
MIQKSMKMLKKLKNIAHSSLAALLLFGGNILHSSKLASAGEKYQAFREKSLSEHFNQFYGEVKVEIDRRKKDASKPDNLTLLDNVFYEEFFSKNPEMFKEKREAVREEIGDVYADASRSFAENLDFYKALREQIKQRLLRGWRKAKYGKVSNPKRKKVMNTEAGLSASLSDGGKIASKFRIYDLRIGGIEFQEAAIKAGNYEIGASLEKKVGELKDITACLSAGIKDFDNPEINCSLTLVSGNTEKGAWKFAAGYRKGYDEENGAGVFLTYIKRF